MVYKARPLNGIWATAPYLHNGSVPNLWELLQKPEKRVVRFWVGSRKFDPVNVGFVTTEGLNEFQVLTPAGAIQAGNSNRGHEAGTDLSDDEKRQLIEYMKTL
ncbi:di-heme-cytochrome C peroxidase [Cellvibrio sp. PSBB006]|uniref:di-heme-cytochrome C peroxidase n=1 Tax=Cellvibrio sp. PSBB006 TaxID=1987723 RepID=UPI002101181E|nr:di-heme-cytochrome C peroxidase [Cellvibrio sp. PSBB006]